MQRLKQRWRNRCDASDRGASSVVVALMMVPLLAFAALAIDIGAMYADRQQLQTGADAGALAIAQDCAREDCGLPGTTVRDMAAANLNADGAVGEIASLNESAGEVSVETSSVREHWFAPLIGIDETEIRTRSSARWGYPTGGSAVLPLTISWCELENQDGVTVMRDSTGAVTSVDIPSDTPELSIKLADLSSSSATDCDGPSGGPTGGTDGKLPGGFGWLRPSGTCGKTPSIIDGWVASDPGASLPSGCSEDDFLKWMGKTVLLPLFEEFRGEGSGGEYRIFGYAGFTISSYSFPSSKGPSPEGCKGGDRCIGGSFDRFVDLTDDFDYSPSGPRLGGAVVALTE